MLNNELLEEKIRDSGLKKGAIAEKIGLTRSGMWQKMIGRYEFTPTEISKLCQILGISLQEKERIFFA